MGEAHAECARTPKPHECPCIVKVQGAYKPFDEPRVPLIQYVCDAEGPEYAAWIASMHPLVGLALADLLESFASCECDEDGDHYPQKSAALTLARLVLGEPEPEGAES